MIEWILGKLGVVFAPDWYIDIDEEDV